MNKTARFLSVGEAAELLGVTSATLRNWDKAGKLVPSRDPLNGYRRYALKSLTAFVAEPKTPYQSPEVTAVDSKGMIGEREFRHLIRQISAAYRDSEGGLLERFEEVTKLLHAKLYDEAQANRNLDYQTKFFSNGDDDHKKTFSRYATGETPFCIQIGTKQKRPASRANTGFQARKAALNRTLLV